MGGGAAACERSSGSGKASRRFRALGAAYIDFALADPGLFRTAFCRPAGHAGQVSARMSTSRPYHMLSGVLDELARCGVLDPARRPFAEIAAWSAVHGLATLLLDGPLASLTGWERDRAIARTLDIVVTGIG